MDRRDFLKTTGAVVAATTVGMPAAAYAGEAGRGRTVLGINRNWRFSPKVHPAARANRR